MLKFSMKPTGADIRGSDVRVDSRGTNFMLDAFGQRNSVRLNLIGDYNVANALAAVGAAHIAGIDVPTIVAGLEALQSVPGRLAAVNEGQPFGVFVDYAHTPDSLAKTMTLLRSLSSGRLIVVFGSAGERDRAKRPLQGAVAANMADFSVITSEDPRFEDPDQIIAEIAAGAIDAGAREGVDVVCREDRRLAIETAFNAARPGDIVLLAGKGHEKCMIYGSERRPWDEAAVASAVLRSRDASSANGMSMG